MARAFRLWCCPVAVALAPQAALASDGPARRFVAAAQLRFRLLRKSSVYSKHWRNP